TLAGYVVHCWVFHYGSTSNWGERRQFILHGAHNDYLTDRLRLVMPSSASIALAADIYFIFSLFVREFILASFFAGFLLGYLIYDECHYAMHHANFKSGLFKKIKDHHMLHHYADPERGFGVSSAIWDVIFDSGFKKKKKKENNLPSD